MSKAETDQDQERRLFDGCSDVDNDEAAADDDADVEDDDDVDDQDDRCCCTESDRSPELGPRYT